LWAGAEMIELISGLSKLPKTRESIEPVLQVFGETHIALLGNARSSLQANLLRTVETDSDTRNAPAGLVHVEDGFDAGDVFFAGSVSQRLDGEASTRSLHWGAKGGALTLTEQGDWEGGLLLEQVVALEMGVLL
jgi:sugar/nucleoside kinase (ribokinase family)